MIDDKFMQKTGLGRGLSSLIPNKNQNPQRSTLSQPAVTGESEKVEIDVAAQVIPDSQEKVYQIPIERVRSNPLQPRRDFNEQAMEELASSIKEHGILEPLIASKEAGDEYLLIAGERRLRAAKMLGLKTVPVVLKTAKDLERLELSLIENIQRHDLNPIEQAEAYNKLKTDFGLTQEELAKRVGKDRAVVANSLRLLNLPAEIKKAVADDKISESHGRTIAGLTDERKQMTVFARVLEKNLSVSQTAQEVKKITIGKPHVRMLSRDPNVAAKEQRLQEVLGTRVRIRKKGEEGLIMVEFYSEEELNGIVDAITDRHEPIR